MAKLSGVQIIVTRPRQQAETWAAQLSSLGAQALVSPVLEICPLHDETAKQRIKQTILDIDQYQKIIFVSQNAVSYGFDWMDQYWPQFPLGVSYFAVGEATARLAREKGLDVTEAGVAMNSEALLALKELTNVEQQKILIMRGVGGRTHLADELSKRGAKVEYCELYQRHRPSTVLEDFKRSVELVEKDRLVLSVHSGESLENLNEVLKCQTHSFYDTPLLVPGARVAKVASDLGFSQVIVAMNATDKAMTQALIAWRQAHAGNA
ncbi:uroporphyrinogen-III synthase [Aurantivibrio plasticivorans]